MKDKKSKVLTEAEEHNIDLGNKLFITEQVKKDYFREHPEEDIDKDFQEAADKYYKPVERRQELYNAISRQYGIKPNFKSNVEKDKEFNNNPTQPTYAQLNNPNKYYYFKKDRGWDGNNTTTNKDVRHAIKRNLDDGYNVVQDTVKYIRDNEKYTKDNDEIQARMRDTEQVNNSQQKLSDDLLDNYDKYGDDAKYLNKTLSSAQRGTKHLENNYNKLVRLIEAKKKKYN